MHAPENNLSQKDQETAWKVIAAKYMGWLITKKRLASTREFLERVKEVRPKCVDATVEQLAELDSMQREAETIIQTCVALEAETSRDLQPFIDNLESIDVDQRVHVFFPPPPPPPIPLKVL